MTKTVRRWLAMAVVVLVAVGAGVGAGLLAQKASPRFPEISVYAHGHTERVGPYMFCNVLNLNECQNPRTQGQLRVTARSPVQLSVPEEIARAPWHLLRIYDDVRDSTVTLYRPNSRLAVTIPTADPHRGRLVGVVVQLSTLVLDAAGELREVPHAEWSVRIVWS